MTRRIGNNFLGVFDGAPPPPSSSSFHVGDWLLETATPGLWLNTAASATGSWTNLGGSTIGATIESDNIFLPGTGVVTTVPLAPDGGQITQYLLQGFTVNGTNDGLVVTVKGRYLLLTSLAINTDPALDLYVICHANYDRSPAATVLAFADPATKTLTSTQAGLAELDVGAVVTWQLQGYGVDTTVSEVFAQIQYLGPATSI